MLERIELLLFRDICNLFVLLSVAGNCEAISPRRQFQIPPFDASEASQHLWLVWEDRSHSKRIHHVPGLNAQLFKLSLCNFTAKKMVKHFALCTTLQQKHTCVCHGCPWASVSLTQLGLGNHHHIFTGKGMFSNNMSIRTKGPPPPSGGVIHMMSHRRSQYSVSCQLLLLFSQNYSDCEHWARQQLLFGCRLRPQP